MSDILEQARAVAHAEAHSHIIVIRLDFLQAMVAEIERLRADRPHRAIGSIGEITQKMENHKR